MPAAANPVTLLPKTLISVGPSLPNLSLTFRLRLSSPPPSLRFNSLSSLSRCRIPRIPPRSSPSSSELSLRTALGDGERSTKTTSSSSSNEAAVETIMLPGCDYNHWLIVMEFPKDPAPTRDQMIHTYLNTLATVLGSMEEAKKNMYAFSTTVYTGFQCTVSEETSEKFKGLPGVLWVLPDSYLDVKNKDYGGDKYVNGEIIPRNHSPVVKPTTKKYEDRKYVRRRDATRPGQRQTTLVATASESSSE